MYFTWSNFGISIVLYALILVYDYKYKDLMEYMEFYMETKQRRIVWNIAGAIELAVDAAGILLLKCFEKGQWARMLIFFALCILAVLHVLNSIFALLRQKKPYTAVDIMTYFVRLTACLALAGIQMLLLNGKYILFTIAALYFLCQKAMRMLDGNWLVLKFEDFDCA